MQRTVIALVLLFIAVHASASEQKPLILDFVVDPALLERAGNNVTVQEIVQDIVGRASLIFNAEIGRRLEVGKIRVALPPAAEEELYVAETLRWLKREKRSRNFLIFIIGRTLRWDKSLGPKPLDGVFLSSDGLAVVVHYSVDTQHTVTTLLHEIGHLCGAKHPDTPSGSIMNDDTNFSATPISYQEAASVIRENCG